MKITCNAADLKTVSKVARKATLSKIHMCSGSFEKAKEENLREKLSVFIDVGSEFFKREGLSFSAQANFHFKGVPQDDDKAIGVKVEGLFILQYKLQDDNDIDDKEIATFCEINAIYNAWPYIREYLAACLTRLDLPPFTMPLLKIGQKKQEKQKAAPVQKKKTVSKKTDKSPKKKGV